MMVSYRDVVGPARQLREDEEMSLHEAEDLARYLRDKMRQGSLTEEDRRKCIALALRFADPERVVAVERSAAHGQRRRQIREHRKGTMDTLVESSCRSDERWLTSPLQTLAEQ